MHSSRYAKNCAFLFSSILRFLNFSNLKLSVIKYQQQIPLSNDSPVRVCLYWNCVLLLRSTSKEFSHCDAMLCCTVYTNQRDLVCRTSIMRDTSVHMADSFPLPLPKYENHAQQFAHNAFGHHHRPASFHALDFCHNQTWQRLPSPISKAISTDNEHIPPPSVSKARFQPQSHSFVAAAQLRAAVFCAGVVIETLHHIHTPDAVADL